MKSITLTKAIREDITKSILDKWIEGNNEPDVATAEDAFAEYLWNDYFKKEKPLLENVPKEFLKLRREMKYCVDGEISVANLKEENMKPVTWDRYNPPVLKSFSSSLKEYDKLQKVLDKKEKWNALKDEVLRETKAVLDSVNTTKQLLEVWPQIEPFLPAYVADADQAIRLPAITMSRLNERIGLK